MMEKIFTKALLKDSVFAFGKIDEGFSGRVIAGLKALVERDVAMATLIINSSGGILPEAFAVIDFMNGMPCPVRTVGLGCIISGGLFIFMNGAQGERILAPNTFVLSHQLSIEKRQEASKYSALRSNRIIEDSLHESVKRLYLERTKLTEKNIKEFIDSEDRLIPPREALELGFCDEIIGEAIEKEKAI